jgi:tetratricopeptide (TPR) repeat protein
MISIVLDESGTFENAKELKKMIGGVIYRGDNFDEEKANLEKFFITQCQEFGISYPSGIHSNVMKDRTKKDLLLNKVKQYLRESGNYYITCMLKSPNEKTTYASFSNIVDEEVASNLYERMITQLIDNLLFYNPYFADEETVVLDLATRSIKVFASDPVTMEKYHQLGYGFKKYPDSTVFFLTDQKTFKTALSTKMMEAGIKRAINYTINVESINYKSNFETTPFLYLADCVCSILRDSLNERYGDYHIENTFTEMTEITGNDFIFFAYDDINDQWNKLFSEFQQGNFIESLESIFKIKQMAPPFVQYYTSHWVTEVESKIFTIFDEKKINLYIGEVEYLLTNKDRERDKEKDLHKGLYIGELLREAIEQFGLSHSVEKVKYRLMDILIRGYNHIGDTEKAKEYFRECERLKSFVSPEDYCATFLNVAQIYANEFEFEEAKNHILQSRTFLIRLKELYQMIAAETGQSQQAAKYPLLGKIESSLGQFYSYQRNPEIALSHFKQALAEIDTPLDREITISYLLHMAIEEKNFNLYQEYVAEYMKSLDLLEQFDYIVREKDSYRMFVFVKSLTAFQMDLSDRLIERLKTLLEPTTNPFNIKVHPWEISFKHIAMIFYQLDKKQEAEKARKLISSVSTYGAELTISVLNLFAEIKLDYEFDSKITRAADNLDKLQALISQNENMEKYFSNVFDEESLEKKVERLNEKFTFTYK